MPAKIVIRHTANSSLTGRTQEFFGGIVRLGRRPGNDVQFDAQRDTKVSGFHVEVRIENGKLLLEDMRSKNGTFLNGNKVTRPTPIASGDKVMLGTDGPEFLAELIGAGPAATIVAAVGAGQESGPPRTIVGSVWSAPAAAPSAPSSNGGYVASLEAPMVPAAAPEVGLPADWPSASGRSVPAGVDRAPSRISQGEAPRRSIGINTLMGELEKSRKSERKRIMIVAIPALVVVAVVTAIIMRNKSADPVQPVNNPSTQPAYSAENWAPVFKKLEPSVYQVQAFIKRDGQANRLGSATAWSVKPGLLATNGHVAALFDDLGPNGYVIARRGSPQNDLKLIKARTHPGYKISRSVYLDHFPYMPEDRRFLKLMQACDIALLEVAPEDIPKQGPALPLAASDVVDVGTPVTYTGFPAEGVSVNYEMPSAYNGTPGTINRTLGLLLDEAPPGMETFLQHSLATVGGASGSPIVNIKGEVVAINFAGDKQGRAEDGTRLSVAGFKYAVPLRLLRELLSGEADAKQRERTALWEKQLRERFDRGVARPKDLLERELENLAPVLAPMSNAPADARLRIKRLDEGVVPLDGTSDVTKAIQIPGPGVYALTVCGDKPGQGMKVDLVLGTQTIPVNQLTLDGEKRRIYYMVKPLPLGDLTGPRNVDVRYSSSTPTKVTYILYQINPPQNPLNRGAGTPPE